MKRSPTAGVSKTVWLRKQTQAAVQAAADANGISVSAQLKRIVDDWATMTYSESDNPTWTDYRAMRDDWAAEVDRRRAL